MKTFAVIAVVATSLGLTAGTARADHDVDELAYTLDRQSEQIARTIYVSFRSASNFQHLYRDAYELHELAHHIHDIAHHGTTYHHMRSDMEKFDRLFAHFLETVEEMESHSLPLPAPAAVGGYGGYSQFGHHNHFGHHSPVDPRALSRLCALLDQTSETVNCLKAEIYGPVARPLPAPAVITPAPVVVPRPIAPVIGPRFPVGGRTIFQTKNRGFSFSLSVAK